MPSLSPLPNLHNFLVKLYALSSCPSKSLLIIFISWHVLLLHCFLLFKSSLLFDRPPYCSASKSCIGFLTQNTCPLTNVNFNFETELSLQAKYSK